MAGVQKRRLLINLLMLSLVAGLGGIVWWSGQGEESGTQGLVALDPQQIQQIAIERRQPEDGVATIRLEKQGEAWMMRQPQSVPANAVRLRQLFTFLNEPVSGDYDAAGQDLAGFGLQPGAATLRFNQEQFVLGNTNSVSGKRYVLHNNRVKLLSEAVFSSLTGDWVNFVSLNLLGAEAVVKAVTLPAGFIQTDELVSSWQQASAIRLEPFNQPPTPAAQEQVELALQSGETLRFLLLGQGEEVILGQPERGIRYFIPAAQASYLLPTPAASAEAVAE